MDQIQDHACDKLPRSEISLAEKTPEMATVVPSWQGAEARIYVEEYKGRPAIIKQRFAKTYRHPILDQKITKQRLRQESKCMVRAVEKAGVRVPELYQADFAGSKLIMEYVQGPTLKQMLLDAILTDADSLSAMLELVATEMGRIISKIHAVDLIHGDLTTSNVVVAKCLEDGVQADASNKYDFVLIDFGLSHVSGSAEDKAVDLYLFERALLSTHPTIGPKLFQMVLDRYGQAEASPPPKKVAKLSEASRCAVLTRLAQVQLRGRKRTMIG